MIMSTPVIGLKHFLRAYLPAEDILTLINSMILVSIIRQARNIGAIEPRRQRTTSATEKRSRTRVHPCPRRG
jgi:hypothetical protein